MARLTAWETYSRCAEDFDRADQCFVSAGKVRRDAAPGTEGHLTSSDMAYPNGVAAKAMKARALARRGQQAQQPARPERLGGCRRSLRRSHPHRRRVRLRPGSGKRVVQQLLGRRLHQRTHLGLERRKRQLTTQTDVWSAVFAYPQANFSKSSGQSARRRTASIFSKTVSGRPAGDRGRASGGDRPGTLRRAGPLLEPRPASGSDGRPRRQRRVDASDRDQHPLRPLRTGT